MKKANLFKIIVSTLLMISMLFTISCDKNADSDSDSNDTSVKETTTDSAVPRADAMAIIDSINSGEKVYKFSYLKPEIDMGDRVHMNYADGVFNETWDRRLFISVGDDYNGALLRRH